jgi:hypothetical protein
MMKHEHNRHAGSHSKHHGEKYDVSLKLDPATPQSNESVRITITVVERGTDNKVGQFDVIHDKLMHLVTVSDDLSYFAHLHPKFDDKDIVFAVKHTFPVAGRYKMWVDAKPKGEGQLIKEFHLDVGGKPDHEPIPIEVDKNFIKNVAANGQEYQVRLKAPEGIKAGQDAEIVFELSDSEGKPIADLETLMAAGGHCVIISADAEKFLHVHLVKEVSADWRGGPEIVFIANFPSPGLYKAWGQFQHRGNIITVSFVLEAK